MTKLATGNPIRARVIERRLDGSARVEVPVVTVTPKLDLAKTEGGGTGSISITAEDLATMVSNFAQWTKPVAVGFDGLDGHQDSRGGPQAVFVDSLRVEGDALLAEMDLNAFAAAMVLNDRSFRGFSMEASRNPKTPTKSLRGWVLTGGVFTNNPATDTQFRIAATGETVADETATISTTVEFAASAMPDNNTGEPKMADQETKQDTVSLTFHEQKLGVIRDELSAKASEADTLRASLKAAEEKIAHMEKEHGESRSDVTTLTDEKAALTARTNRLEAELKAAREAKDQLSVALNEQSEKLREAESAALTDRVKQVVTQAIDDGVPPAIFDGYESDPAAWMTGRYTSFESFENTVAALRGVTNSSAGSALKSGHDPAKSGDDKEQQMTDEEKARFAARGIRTDIDFRNVTDGAEALKRFRAAKQNK